MVVDDIFLLVIGGALTVLALASGFLIVVEVVAFVRELGGSRPKAMRQNGTSVREAANSGSLTQRKVAESGLSASVVEPIQPMRDADVVRQLIEHFKEDDSSPVDG